MTTRDTTSSYSASYVLRETLRGYLARVWHGWHLFSRQPIGLLGLFLILVFGAMAVLHPILLSTVWPVNAYNPITLGEDILTEQILSGIMHPAPPSLEHLLGTDPFGRDILSQLMYSARNEFVLGVIAALVTLVVATTVGAFSAYYPGIIDSVLMRMADLIIMMPALSLLIVLGTLWNLDFWSLAIVVGVLAGFGGAAVIIKSQALTIKVRPFIDAARVSGSGNFRIIFSHIIPNLLPLAFLYMMFTVTTAIFSEAILSFFGVLDVDMSWGTMLSITQSEGYLLNFQTWWLTLPAGLAVSLLCGSFYLVGRGLDPIVNPRLRRR